MMAGRSQMHSVLPGVALGIIYRYQEMKKCLYSDCEFLVLKAEKILSVLAYVLGFATPGQVIWKILKILVKKSSTQIAAFLDDHPSVETSLQISLFTAEQYGLAHVWDLVRDGSICMRFYNCDNEFLAQLSNIKITICNVQNPRDEKRALSVCERMFNDSPLIMLGVGMLILTAFATTKLSPEDLPPTKPDDKPPKSPDNSPKKSDDPSKTSDEPPKKSDEPPIVKEGPSTADAPKLPNDSNPPNPKGSNSKQDGMKQDHLKKKVKTPKVQDIHARCPNCRKDFDFKVPRPWNLGCAHSAEHSHKTNSKQDKTIEKVIREVFKDIKCNYCKSKIKKRLIELQQKKGKKGSTSKNNKKT